MLIGIVLWVATTADLYVYVLKNSSFSSCLFKALLLTTQSALIGQLTQAWTCTTHHLSSLVFSGSS